MSVLHFKNLGLFLPLFSSSERFCFKLPPGLRFMNIQKTVDKIVHNLLCAEKIISKMHPYSALLSKTIKYVVFINIDPNKLPLYMDVGMSRHYVYLRCVSFRKLLCFAKFEQQIGYLLFFTLAKISKVTNFRQIWIRISPHFNYKYAQY
jgi:hypothetical protein